MYVFLLQKKRKNDKVTSQLRVFILWLIALKVNVRLTITAYCLVVVWATSVIQHSLFKSRWWRRRRRSATREQNSCYIGLSSRTFLYHNPLIILTPHFLWLFVINLFAWVFHENKLQLVGRYLAVLNTCKIIQPPQYPW